MPARWRTSSVVATATNGGQHADSRLQAIPWYAASVPPLLVLHLYAGSVASTFAVGRAGIAAMLGAVLIAVLLGIVVGERARAGVAATAVIAALVVPVDPAVLLGAVAFAALAALAARSRTPARDRAWGIGDALCKAGTAGLSIVVVLELLSGGAVDRVMDDLANEGPWRPALADIPVDPRAVGIFVVVLDGYPRADILAEKTGMDNSGFLGDLTDLGFDVASRSRASYVLTRLTLASLLNMRHLADLPAVQSSLEDPTAFASALRNALDHAAGPEILRSLGYEFVAVSPGYEPTALRRADRFVDAGAPNEFELVALTSAGFGRVLELLAPDLVDDLYRARLLETLDLIVAEAELTGGRPQFVVAHVPAPHPPFAFDEGGSPLSVNWIESPISRFTYEYDTSAKTAAFGDYVAWTNGAVLPVITRVVEVHPDAVVIVMSDHGPDIDVDWGALTAANSRERVANLFAARVPGRPALFGDAPTTVNILPVLLNGLFDLGIPLAGEHSVLQSLEEPFRPIVYPAPADASGSDVP